MGGAIIAGLSGDGGFTKYQPPSLGALTGKQLKSLKKYGLDSAQTMQDISAKIAPQEQAMLFKLLQEYAPQYSKVGADLAEQQAKDNLALVEGSGTKLAESAIGLDRLANPEFYNNRETANKGFTSLIEGQDPNKLSGAEEANVERSVNRLNARTGNLNTGDASTTVGNAMLFGDELGKKRDRFAQALSLFPGVNSASRSPIDAFGVASGRESTPNFGTSQFQMQNGMQGIQGFQDRVLSTQQKQLEAKMNRSALTEDAGPKACCFIMIAANAGIELPWWIRECRDYFYKKDPKVRKGYKRMALWLVPLMKKHQVIKTFIKWTMYHPISMYGKYLVGESKLGYIFKPVKSFWFNIWRNI